MILIRQFRRLTNVFWKTATPDQLDETFNEYHNALTSVPTEAIERAIDGWMETGKKMPLPSELRELAFATLPKREAPVQSDRPCPACNGVPCETVDPRNGFVGRLYVRHEPECRLLIGLKPERLVWRDEYEGEVHEVAPERPDDDGRVGAGVAKVLAFSKPAEASAS